MSEKNSEGRRRYWASMSPEKRSERMRDIVTKRWATTSTEDRRKYALKMVEGRKNKKVIS